MRIKKAFPLVIILSIYYAILLHANGSADGNLDKGYRCAGRFLVKAAPRK
jgi:hypothetical protein